MNRVKTLITLLLPVCLMACSSTGSYTSQSATTAAKTVSIEVVPSLDLTSGRNTSFSQCVGQNDTRVVSKFSRSFYANLSTMAQQRGIAIRGIGEANKDVIVSLKIKADGSRGNIKTTTESYSIDSKGRVSRSVRRTGSTVTFQQGTQNQAQACQLITGDVPSGFSQQINSSAQELAKTTLDAMVRKGMM